MAAPTYPHKTPAVEPGPESNLGGQVVDGNRVAIQGLGSGFVTTDVSGSPITSPATATGTVTILNVPLSAIRVIISNTDATNSLFVSELSDASTYYLLPKGATQSFDLGRQSKVYVKSSSSSTVFSFAFQIVD